MAWTWVHGISHVFVFSVLEKFLPDPIAPRRCAFHVDVRHVIEAADGRDQREVAMASGTPFVLIPVVRVLRCWLWAGCQQARHGAYSQTPRGSPRSCGCNLVQADERPTIG